MAHQLIPRSRTYVDAREVARRLATAFPHVIVDETEGAAEALRRASWIESATPAVFLGRHEEALAFARRLRSLFPGEALSIRFGDEEHALVRIAVLPGEPITFGYSGPEQEEALRSIVERCAEVLEADLVRV